MNFDKKFLYMALIVVGIALVVGPAFGLKMRSNAVRYRQLSSEQAEKIKKLEATVAGLRATLQDREDIISQHQMRVADLSKAHRDLRKRNETLILDMQESEKQTHELLVGKNELSHQLELVAAEKKELAQVKEKLSSQLKLVSAEAEDLAKAKRAREEALRNQKQLIDSLQKEIDAGQVKIAELAGLTTVRLEDKILFDSSKATIKDSGREVLKKIGQALAQIKDKHIQVQGHTDSRKIRWDLQRRYPTNWELSAARAATIVRYLIDEVGIDPARLSAAGYSFHHPIASNETPEGQQENRRVEFSLMPLRTDKMSDGQ